MKVAERVPISLAARTLGISEQWLRQLADSGKIPCGRDAFGRRFFDSEVITRFVKERAQARKVPVP